MYAGQRILSVRNNFSYQRPLSLRNGSQTVRLPQVGSSSWYAGEISSTAIFGRAANSVLPFYRRGAAGEYENNITNTLTWICMCVYECVRWDMMKSTMASLANAEIQAKISRRSRRFERSIIKQKISLEERRVIRVKAIAVANLILTWILTCRLRSSFRMHRYAMCVVCSVSAHIQLFLSKW